MIAVAAAGGATHGTFSGAAVLVAVGLLFANGAFVAVEISLLAARRTRIQQAAEAGDRRARRALRSLSELSVTFSGAQLGITMCSLGLGAVAEPALAALLIDWFGATPLPPGFTAILAFAIALSVVVFLHMVLGEMAPKNLALVRPEAVALTLSRPFALFVVLLRPLIVALNGAANLLVGFVGIEQVDERKLVRTPDELALVLAESRQLGSIADQDARVMGAALRLASIDAQSAMTPRVDLAAIADTASITDALDVAEATGHTRIPVYHGGMDHVIGVLHVKDILVSDDAELSGATVLDLLRPLPAVPKTRDLDSLLRTMLAERTHAVLVVDEHGGTAGLLTLEDVLEQLVGHIDDEYDTEQHARRTGEQVWVVPGIMRRRDVERFTGIDLDGEGESATLSGVMVGQLGRLLRRGDRVTIDGWQLTVLSLDGRRAHEIEVRAPAPQHS